MGSPRAVYHFVSPEKEVNAGLWSLFAGATAFLGVRLWCKLTRRNGLWWDDYILILAWANLLATDSVITHEMATGYVTKTWDDRMLILVSVSSCGTLLGQAWSKSAFAVSLLRITNRWQQAILWFCIATLNMVAIVKIFLSWAKYCDQRLYQNYWRMQGFCIDYYFTQRFKVFGNVYNIVMDFVLAIFPWLVVWKLKMTKWEKVGLCWTMSLGVVVAVISAARIAWTESPGNENYDDYYFWRQGLGMVWYSAEVAGTIIVQSIPVMRPMIHEIKSVLDSRKAGATEEGLRSLIQTPLSNRSSRGNGTSNGIEYIALNGVQVQDAKSRKLSQISLSPSELARAIEASHTQPLSRSQPVSPGRSLGFQDQNGLHS
ncbi:hypothetical protein F4775DRAFT_545642 [Biscogniauxia sp. FL1348]|nr:hypothetical protein F4775DRAFT_545642 [Biscogniauxia sp. FL1348]